MVNEFDRKCILTKENVPKKKEESAYAFLRSGNQAITDGSMLYDSINMFNTLQKYIKDDLEINIKENTTLKLNYDQQCSFLGNMRENLSVEKETYFECDCADKGYGTTCQFRGELYGSVNKFVAQMLKDVKN
jgi:hypothetical protein